jgi:hypothetical protein
MKKYKCPNTEECGRNINEEDLIYSDWFAPWLVCPDCEEEMVDVVDADTFTIYNAYIGEWLTAERKTWSKMCSVCKGKGFIPAHKMYIGLKSHADIPESKCRFCYGKGWTTHP